MGEDLYKEVQTGLPAERALDVAAFVTSVVPWLGGPISGVLSGIAVGRKIDRINEVILGLAERVRDIESAASKQYVTTDAFEDILEQTLRQVAGERNDEKRRIYRDFLVGAVTAPGEAYDEQTRFLRSMEELQGEHLRVLRAIAQKPTSIRLGGVGSPIATLRSRLSDLSEAQIEERVEQLNDMRILRMNSLRTMMTPSGAEDLGGTITPYGRRFLRYLSE
jgi:hypothetical protein